MPGHLIDWLWVIEIGLVVLDWGISLGLTILARRPSMHVGLSAACMYTVDRGPSSSSPAVIKRCGAVLGGAALAAVSHSSCACAFGERWQWLVRALQYAL